MVIKNVNLETVCGITSVLPKNTKPEIAFAGKSNVGKSSFINTMINRKKLARTSSEPGKTRQINFYDINQSFYFVDLPGYGYSKMSKVEQARVGNFIEEYLSTSKNIALIIFLIDIRHLPSENDRLMYDYVVRSGRPFIILANKADKIAITKVENSVEDLQNALNPLHDFVFLPFSSERRIYSDNVWKQIELYL